MADFFVVSHIFRVTRVVKKGKLEDDEDAPRLVLRHFFCTIVLVKMTESSDLPQKMLHRPAGRITRPDSLFLFFAQTTFICLAFVQSDLTEIWREKHLQIMVITCCHIVIVLSMDPVPW